MNDPVYQKAVQERDAAQRKVDQLNQFIATYQMLASQTAPRPPSVRAGLSLAEFRATVDKSLELAGLSLATKRERVIDAAVRCLGERQPQSTDDLLAGVKALGVEVGGANEAVNLSSYLSKSDKFIHSRKDGGWSLKPEWLSPRPDGGESTGAEDLA